MPTPTTNFRLSRETLASLERIADLVRRHRTAPVTTADVVRWLAARHDAKNDPELNFTYEQALVFPAIYPSVSGLPLANTATAGDSGPADIVGPAAVNH